MACRGRIVVQSKRPGIARGQTPQSYLVTWFFGNLGTVPDCDDPNLVFLHAIEGPIGPYVDLAVRKPGKFRDKRA